MTTVAEGITRLGSSFHNFYVVEEGGRATVIDVGCSGELPALQAGLQQVGLSLDDVEAVLLTHAHADHAGAARAARDEGVDVRAHVDEVPRLDGTYEGKAAIDAWEFPIYKPRVLRFLLTLTRRGVLRQPPVADPTTFGDGEVLDLPGSPVVVHTPGHTEGHSAFHLPSRDVVFTGDALVTDAFWTPLGPQVMPDRFHNDPAQAATSLARLESLDAQIVLPGHGDPFEGGVAECVAAARRR